jgi:pimeloyl-ACP methyl ester carboxylesterase
MTRPTAVLILAVSALAAGVGCRGPRPGAPTSACTHVQAVRQLRGAAACEDVWTCTRPPGGPYDRIGLHRLAACEGADGPVVLYLPGMHMNGDLPLVDARHDLRVYLAAAGFRTWGLDYRTHAVPPDATPGDLETLRRWTADLFTDDAAWAAAFVRGADPGPLYVGGFSQGAAFAYRLAARPNVPVAGLVILDGDAGGGRGPGPGDAAIDVGGSRLPWAERQRLLAAVVADPGGPSPVAGFPTAGGALAEILWSSPTFGGEGGLANTRDGVSDVQVLATLLRSYDRWWPRATLAGAAPKPTRSVPVLAFASRKMGPAWVERVRGAARAFGGDTAVVRELPGYGHLDVLVGRRAPLDVFEPARAWLVRPAS